MFLAIHFNLTIALNIWLWYEYSHFMQIFQEWCERSEFIPDEKTDDAKINTTPNEVSWLKIPYRLSKALQNHVAEHEKGQWTFPQHLIPPFTPGKIYLHINSLCKVLYRRTLWTWKSMKQQWPNQKQLDCWYRCCDLYTEFCFTWKGKESVLQANSWRLFMAIQFWWTRYLLFYLKRLLLWNAVQLVILASHD